MHSTCGLLPTDLRIPAHTDFFGRVSLSRFNPLKLLSSKTKVKSSNDSCGHASQQMGTRGGSQDKPSSDCEQPLRECRLVQLSHGQPGMSYDKTTPQVSYDEWLAGKPGFGNFVSVWSGANDKRVTLSLPSDMIDPMNPCGALARHGETG